MLISGGSGLLSLVIAAARNAPHVSLVFDIPSIALCLGLGWALLRGYEWAYIPVLLLLLASEGWAAWFFFISGTADRYSLVVRLVDGLLVLALGSLPIVLMLSASARKWARGADVQVL
jgi:hypothetical protein